MILKKKLRILKITLSFLRRVNPHLFHLQVKILLWTSILKLSHMKFYKITSDTNIGIIFRPRNKLPLPLFDKIITL